MVSQAEIQEQLERIGCNNRFWGRAEIRELAAILMKDEIIAGCVNGRYPGGFALLCATNHRLLLIDRKPMFLTLEDIRFDMIAEIDYSAHLLDSTVRVLTPNRTMTFRSWNHGRLRAVATYTQQRVMEVRQHYLMLQQFQGLPMAPYPNPYTKVPMVTRNRRQPIF